VPVGDRYTADVEMDRINHVETIYKYALVGLLLVVIFSLGQALFFMMTDKDNDKRTVWALTRRIGLSLLLIGMVALGIWMGWLHPHDIGQ
jgi:cytochrome bd-type quinol oxidase subunit 2